MTETAVRKSVRRADVLVIAFTSMNAFGEKVAAFDFEGLEGQEDFDTLLVRDLENTWFHGPLVGPEWGCWSLASYLRAACQGYDRVVCLGSSMGGYAALLYGSLIRADHVLAFSPQTVAAPNDLRRMGDDRYLWQLDLVSANVPADEPLNLDRLACRRADIFVSQDEPVDLLHAAQVVGAKVHKLANVAHNLIEPVKDTGLLRAMVSAAVKGKPLPEIPPVWSALAA